MLALSDISEINDNEKVSLRIKRESAQSDSICGEMIDNEHDHETNYQQSQNDSSYGATSENASNYAAEQCRFIPNRKEEGRSAINFFEKKVHLFDR